MRIRTRVAAVLGMTSLLVTGVGIGGASAVDFHSCPSGDLCVWLGQNFTQSPSGLVGGAKFSQTNASWSGYTTWNDDESWVNHSASGNSAGVYALTNYSGWIEVCLYPGTTLTNTGTPGQYSQYMNQGESNKWKSGNGCYAAS